MDVKNNESADMIAGLDQTPHKRRAHYAGRYPKKFEEKYKEHDASRYADTVAHVIAKGSTPAGMHISIMVEEILEVLRIEPGERGVDATLGYGGHTRRMLEALQDQGHICGLDVDPIESEKTLKRLREAGYGEEIFTRVLTNFANIGEVAKVYGTFDFALADLGVSSMQIDDPSRGFSYKVDGPLDLRMNPTSGESGAVRLAQLSKSEIEAMLTENADEPYAGRIAAKICEWRKKKHPIETTTDLKEVVAQALSHLPQAEQKEAIKKSCMRTFQALRIDVNSEFEVLYQFLDTLPTVLNAGARVAILTFHSGEDRLVKKAFKEGYRAGIYREISEEVIKPSSEECRRNPRAHSTKLRWAIKA